MTPTAEVAVPRSTVTVESTLLRTAYVTVTGPTTLVQPAPSSSSSSSSASTSISSTSTPGVGTSVASLALNPGSTQPGSPSTLSSHACLPTVVTQSALMKTPQASKLSPNNTKNLMPPTVTSQPMSQSTHLSQKHAIIGGLAGAIAGFVLIGLLLFLWMRRRRRREEDSEVGSLNDKGIRPAIKRKWTDLTGQGTPRATPQIPPESSPIRVDEDHHFIRMCTQHWPRPFAAGQGEGFRDSVAPGQLRVMNPDPSRPTTSRLSSDTAGGFLRRQRSALAAVLLNVNRSRTTSPSNLQARPQVPEITIDPVLSQECIAPTARTLSFRSYPSVNSSLLVSQQPPEDPFWRPDATTDEKTEEAAQQKPKRPSLAPLHSTAGTAGRTLSHIGSVLNSFQTKSGFVESVRTVSHQSISTLSSRFSRHNTSYSDPFDLDKPSIRGSDGSRERVTSTVEQNRRPNWIVYDGT